MNANLNKFDINIADSEIYLAPLKKNDAEILRNWRNQENIRNYYIFKEIITSDQQDLWWADYEKNKNDFMFFIRLNGSNMNIGAIALYNICGQEAEFGRLMIPDVQNRGRRVALKACRLILQFGFERLGLQRIYLRVLTENIKAKNVYHSAGFNFTHANEEVDFYELTATEWLNKKQPLTEEYK